MAKQKESAKAKVKTKPLPQKKIKQRNQVKKGPHGGVRVVLVEDVTHVGRQGEVVEVRPGYAAQLPDSEWLWPSFHRSTTCACWTITKCASSRHARPRKSDLKSLAEQISRTKSINIEANATEEGHLYGSVGPQEIARSMRGKNLLVEPDMIKLAEPLKFLGEFPVQILLGYEVESRSL